MFNMNNMSRTFLRRLQKKVELCVSVRLQEVFETTKVGLLLREETLGVRIPAD